MPILLALLVAAPPALRVDLSALKDPQRDAFLQVAADVNDYAGCRDTLLKCLDKGQKDPHALRMAELLMHLVQTGAPAQVITNIVEKYYDAFDAKARLDMKPPKEAPVLGKGPVEIVEFSDYQCPHCAVAAPVLDALVTKAKKGKAQLCARYFPFSSHPRARVAALCAEYARQHGKFWEMHASLFAHQDNLDDDALKGYAKALGLNADEMLAQAYAGKFDDAVDKGVRQGTAAGVDSTPTLFFNGRLYALPVSDWYLQFSVDDELQWNKEHGWKFPGAKQARK
jgi:protein-disulfide isomerase